MNNVLHLNEEIYLLIGWSHWSKKLIDHSHGICCIIFGTNEFGYETK